MRVYSLLTENVFVDFRVFFSQCWHLPVCLSIPLPFLQFSFSIIFVYVELLPAQLQRSSVLAARLVVYNPTTSAAEQHVGNRFEINPCWTKSGIFAVTPSE